MFQEEEEWATLQDSGTEGPGNVHIPHEEEE